MGIGTSYNPSCLDVSSRMLASPSLSRAPLRMFRHFIHRILRVLDSRAVSRPLDKEIARARARRDKAAALAKAADASYEALLRSQRELFEMVEEHRVLDLHTADDSSTVKHMQTEVSQKRIGRPVLSKHPFVAKAVKLHGSVKAAAKALGVSPSTARSWYADSEEDGRPIPETMVTRLAKAPWSIPVAAWKRRS